MKKLALVVLALVGLTLSFGAMADGGGQGGTTPPKPCTSC
jgi:hypothetical protein